MRSPLLERFEGASWLLSSDLGVQSRYLIDRIEFDPFSLFDDGLCAAEVCVRRCHIGKALVISAVILVLDEGFDLAFEIAGQVVVFE